MGSFRGFGDYVVKLIVWFIPRAISIRPVYRFFEVNNIPRVTVFHYQFVSLSLPPGQKIKTDKAYF